MIAYFFDRAPILRPLDVNGTSYMFPNGRIKSHPADPISRYVLENMVLIQEHTLANDFAVKCYVDKTVYIKEILKINPNNPELYCVLGYIYRQRGELEKALYCYNKTLAINPNQADACYNIACLYAKEGNAKNALYWLKVSVDKGFHNWDLIRKDPDLATVRNNFYVRELMKKSL